VHPNEVISCDPLTLAEFHVPISRLKRARHQVFAIFPRSCLKQLAGSSCAELLRPMSHLQFYRVILSHNFIARQRCSTQLCMSHTATLSHKQKLTNQLGQCLFMRQSCSVRHTQLHAATLSRHKVARKNRAIKCDSV